MYSLFENCVFTNTFSACFVFAFYSFRKLEYKSCCFCIRDSCFSKIGIRFSLIMYSKLPIFEKWNTSIVVFVFQIRIFRKREYIFLQICIRNLQFQELRIPIPQVLYSFFKNTLIQNIDGGNNLDNVLNAGPKFVRSMRIPLNRNDRIR